MSLAATFTVVLRVTYNIYFLLARIPKVISICILGNFPYHCCLLKKSKKKSETLTECQMDLIQIDLGPTFSRIWVLIVCKGYHPTAKEQGKYGRGLGWFIKLYLLGILQFRDATLPELCSLRPHLSVLIVSMFLELHWFHYVCPRLFVCQALIVSHIQSRVCVGKTPDVPLGKLSYMPFEMYDS